jgi:glycosyltransferase involved in cell wall biosynthesis
MKVVVNALSARLGGGKTYLANLFAHLPETAGLELLVFAPEDLTWQDHRRIRRLRTRWPTTNPVLRTFWERFVLPRILKEQRADVLFCPGGVVTTAAPPGCKVVTMFRNMTPFDDRAMRSIPLGLQRLRLVLLRRAMLRSMRKADLTVFISDFARGVIEAIARIPHSITIPHGVSQAFRVHGRLERPPKVGEGKYLLYVSKFDTYKHHLEVVQAYATLPSVVRATYRLVLVGESDRRCAQAVSALIEQEKLEGRVVVYGAAPHDELPALYQHASANLFASSCENCPNILLEALASGRPVLSSNVMPMPEFGGKGIEYFSPFDPADIARAMMRVLTDAEHAESVAAAALAQSLHFDWAATANRTWSALAALA